MDVPRLVEACGAAAEMCRLHECSIDVEIGKSFGQGPIHIQITPLGVDLAERETRSMTEQPRSTILDETLDRAEPVDEP